MIMLLWQCVYPCRQEGHLKCNTWNALLFCFICTSGSVHFFCTFFALNKDVGFKCKDWQEVERKHFKMKCNIGMKRGTRSKMMCKIRAHFPPIWETISSNGIFKIIRQVSDSYSRRSHTISVKGTNTCPTTSLLVYADQVCHHKSMHRKLPLVNDKSALTPHD